MDPVCHTLVGAALGESGLKRRSRLGMATLIVAANLPDIDVLSFAAGPVEALGFRRGWTHGLPALMVLPWLLVGLVVLWDRWTRTRGRRLQPVRPMQLLLLAYVAGATHPALDQMNVYGMRWLMPFIDGWQYADVLFIVDPWIWAVLAAGVYLSWRRARRGAESPGRPASIALGAAAAYIVVMAAGSLGARRLIGAELERNGLSADAPFMAAPVPVNPFRRVVVIDRGDHYRVGAFRWLPTPRVEIEAVQVDRNDSLSYARRAAATRRGRTFLRWARYPFFLATASADSVVHIVDARYTFDTDVSFGVVSIRLADER